MCMQPKARIEATSETTEVSLKLLYMVIYCHLALCYTLKKKKVRIKLEELIEKKTVL